MTTAVAVCALCGDSLRAARCPECGHRTEPGWPTPHWQPTAQPAGTGPVVGGLAIDAVLIAAAALVGQLLGRWAGLTQRVEVTIAVVFGLIAFVIAGQLYCTRGRALGHRLVHARALLPSSGLPAQQWLRLWAVRFFNTRPIDPIAAPHSEGAIHPDGASAHLERRVPVPTVILPNGNGVPVSSRTIIGRYPASIEPDATTVDVNDLTRTMSRAHVALEADSAGQVVAIDLNSANGTSVMVNNMRTRLKPLARVPMTLPCVLICGTQALQLIDAEARPQIAVDPRWTVGPQVMGHQVGNQVMGNPMMASPGMANQNPEPQWTPPPGVNR